ncbi:dockerin type I domain-containing protein [Halorubrum rubrum]|uniref:Dockerin type I domain-containing protein n=1 Tax=Halorubrum rubrum TaxID=1126240 RepID=A0ABD5QYS0_9EURY|nr:dockerin type I domain-containing protein [Halorubrum rubrum]
MLPNSARRDRADAVTVPDAATAPDGSDRDPDPPDATGLSRRSFVRIGGATAAALLAGASDATSGVPSGAWTVVALPDTQYFTINDRWYRFAIDQIDWIVENADAENVAFVTHEGDVVDEGDEPTQWVWMDVALSALDGVVPYSTLPGNHDYAETGVRRSGLDDYAAHFGASRFDGRDWFGGTGPGDEEANSYQLFSAGGYDFLHLALEWEPRDVTLQWAQGVLNRYPERPTLLTTHSYLTDGDARRDPNGDELDGAESDPGRTRYVQEADGDGNHGEAVWRDLVEPNAQVFAVLCGHYHENDGEYHQTSENRDGLPVYELLANYQAREGTGFGRLRLLTFVPDGGEDAPDRIQVHTYSPHLDEYEVGDDSRFSFDLDFEDRFSASLPSRSPGDVDGDGDVDDDDVELVQRYLTDRDIEIDRDAADANRDGEIDVTDVVEIANERGSK